MKTKKKKEKEVRATDFFKPTEIGPSAGVDLQGKLVIVAPSSFKPEYRQRKFLIWRAMGGFGCDPNALGSGVFSKCIGDGEEAKLCRSRIVGLFLGEEKDV